MKVLMLKSFSGPFTSYRKGEVYDLPEPKALRWLRDGCASPVKQEREQSVIIPIESEEEKMKAEQILKDQKAEADRLAKEAEDERLRIEKEKTDEEERIKAEKKAKSDAIKLKAKEKREKATIKAEETAVTDVQVNNTTVKRTVKPARGKGSSKSNRK